MDEQSDRKFQLEKAAARQRALRESISQELALYRGELDKTPPKPPKKEEEGDIHKKIVETRVQIEDARQRVAYNVRRLSEEFKIDINPKDYILQHPRKSLLLAFACGFYFGLKK